MCFRLLYTMHECGLLEKVGENQYRLAFPLGGHRKFRIGYADQDRSSSFSQEVFDGLVRACQRAQVELIMVDNRSNPKVAVKNAERLVREHVDLAVEDWEDKEGELASIFVDFLNRVSTAARV